MPLNYADSDLKLSLKTSKVLIVDDQLLSIIVLKKYYQSTLLLTPPTAVKKQLKYVNLILPISYCWIFQWMAYAV